MLAPRKHLEKIGLVTSSTVFLKWHCAVCQMFIYVSEEPTCSSSKFEEIKQDAGSIFLRNVGKPRSDYTALRSRKILFTATAPKNFWPKTKVNKPPVFPNDQQLWDSVAPLDGRAIHDSQVTLTTRLQMSTPSNDRCRCLDQCYWCLTSYSSCERIFARLLMSHVVLNYATAIKLPLRYHSP